MSVCAFYSVPNSKYSNLSIVAAFSSNSISGKTSLPVKNSYLWACPDDKAEILILLSFVLINFVIDCFDFLTNTYFYNKSILNRSGLPDGKLVSFTKNEYGSLV